MRDLYDLHNDPGVLYGFKHRNLLPRRIATRVMTGKVSFDQLSEKEKNNLYSSPKHAVMVAEYLQRRLPKAETGISQDAELAMDYALNVIRGPFPEAESTILNHDGYSIVQYAVFCLGKRWPDGEQQLYELNDHEAIQRYAEEFNLKIRYHPETSEYQLYTSPTRGFR